jgi:exopolysaccharide biosynthesis polyprenyl glycosylphosphotransferase
LAATRSREETVAALRKLEIEVQPAQRRVASRPIVLTLVPAFDGIVLLAAVAVAGIHPLFIATAALTFVALNADTSRAYRLNPRVGDEIGWLFVRLAVPLLVLVSMAALDLLPWSIRELDRLVIAGSAGVLLVLAGRAVAYSVNRTAKARGFVSERTVVVGAGPVGIEIAEALDRHPEYGLSPIGFIDGPTSDDLPYPLLGGPHDLGRVVGEWDVRRLVIAFGHGRDRELATLIREQEELPIEVHIVPRFFELGAIAPGWADDVRGIPLVHLRRPAFRGFARLSKRVFDAVFASLMLVLLSPIFLVTAIAVRISSPGPVLFRQVRIGRRGQPFEMLKFRTMHVEEESEPSWTPEEHRVTRVGKWLRRTSVDELPQLINVVRGDMSLVGPRPERPHFVERFSDSYPAYADRHRVQGGVTGLAQVNGRSRGLDSIPERLRLDNSYIETRSLWGDVLILCRTVGVVFRGDSDCE